MTGRSGARRHLRTVLFTDIVGSTDTAAQLGDQRWRSLVARHHEVIRRELKRHRGREMDTAGDGFFATFENPTDGVHCGAAVVAAVHGLGLRIRAGLHTGEVESSGEKAAGIAVHIAARLLALAMPEEVLVSGTLHDLVAGSGQEFEDRGVHELKGVPGEWRVWALVLPPLDEAAIAATEEDAEKASRFRRRQRFLLVGLVGALALVVLGVAAALVLPRPKEPITSGPDSVVAFSTSDGRASTGAPTGGGPGALEIVDASVWTANIDAGTLTRVDASSGESETVGQVSSRPTDLTHWGRLLWVADRYSDQVTLLDAGSGDLQERVDLHASAIDAGPSGIWAADDLFDRIRRLDPRTGAELSSVELPAGSGASDLDASGETVWVAAAMADAVLPLDPGSGTVGASVDVPDVERISVAGTDLWAVSPATDAATRVDASTSRVAVAADVCDTPVAVAAVPESGGAWIVCSVARALWHVDHSGNADTKVSLDAVPTDVALDGGTVWVALRQD